jgi:hypothetical protein
VKPPEDHLDGYGPAMRALTPLQRQFVRQYVADPSRGTAAARRAGYSDHLGADRVTAHHLLRHDKVRRAITEEVANGFQAYTPIGLRVLLEVAENPDHPRRLDAAEKLLNRGGFHAMSEQRIKVEHSDMTGEAMIERIKQLAVTLGVDPAKLLGGNDPKLIEATVVDPDTYGTSPAMRAVEEERDRLTKEEEEAE